MARNFGNRNRDMMRAAKNAFNDAVGRGELSFASAANYADRFGKFVEYARDNGIKYMEKIDKDTVIDYGKLLADQVQKSELSAAYAQNLVSAVNSTINIASRHQVTLGVSPTKDCGIANRSAIRDIPSIGKDRAEQAIQQMRESGMDRQATVAELALNLGLRSKEASLLNAKIAYRQAADQNKISVSDGTKGGRPREIAITHDQQLRTLQSAAECQGDNRAVMPSDQNWKQWYAGGLRDGREMLHQHEIKGYHEFRSEYACQRYETITGVAAPCNHGDAVNKEVDRDARNIIANELGHGRIDVTNEYLGNGR